MAAYRAAEKIEDHTYQKTHDYSRKEGVLHAEIMAPEAAPDWVYDRQALWNAVEQSELTKKGDLKKSAQLARDILVPLPHELGLDANREALREWIDSQFVSRGMVADFAIHAPSKEGDQRNLHAHIMLTMREITPEGFHQTKATPTARSWNSKDMLDSSIDALEQTLNRELEKAGFADRVAFQSYEARGIDKEAEQKEGVAVTAKKRRGEETDIAKANDERRQRNAERQSRHMKALHELARVEEERERFNDWTARKAAELDTAQRLSLIELERRQELQAGRHEEKLQEAYEPQLQAVEIAAERLRHITEDKGFLLGLRRLWQGKKDLEELEALRRTIENTKARMKEARDRLAAAHAKEKQRLIELQLERQSQQQEGFQRKEAEKAAEFAEREAKAQQEAEATATPKTDLAAELDRVRKNRREWSEDKRREALKKSAKDIGRDKDDIGFER